MCDDNPVPLSALQHLLYCRRRAALVHVERAWMENRLTADGRNRHERTHAEATEARGNVVIAHSVPLRSYSLGLSGKADVVEFHRLEENKSDSGVNIARRKGFWLPYPVEYKRGKKREEEGYKIQLCAQGLCLEEMLDVHVPEGALFYAASGRRMAVEFSPELRTRTTDAAEDLHELLQSNQVPPARHDNRCKRCSLKPRCLPSVTGQHDSARGFIERELDRSLDDEGTDQS